MIKGEKHRSAKLTNKDVLEIRKRWEEGEAQVTIAKNFPCNQDTISKIVRHETWKHI